MTHADANSSPVSSVNEMASAVSTATMEATSSTLAPRAFINEDACISCGVCAHLCSFGAIGFNRESRKYYVNRTHCATCYVCVPVCPTEAISMVKDLV